jgi:segregation and condensation protein B
MIDQNHDDDLIDLPEITFSLTASSTPGEPVFPNEESERFEAEGQASEELEFDSSLHVELDMSDESLPLTITDDLAVDAEAEDPFLLSEQLTLSGKIEAIVFASPKPMRAVEIHDLLMEFGHTLKEVQDACDELTDFYRDRAGGVHLKYIKRMGYQFQTTPAAKSLMERQFSSRPRPLSRAALETLAVIAYRQKQSKGVTRAEVEFIRGVDAGSIFKTLVERNLLACTGRKEIPGRPMIFGVTEDFLRVFQLGSINDLPPLESFQTPKDVLDSANQKIAEFEAEQEGVDTDEFLNDEEYASEVQSLEDFNALTAAQPVYAPTLARLDEVIEGVAASSTDTLIEGVLETESDVDLMDDLGEGQVAWVAAEVHTEHRLIQGAVCGEIKFSMDSNQEEEWDNEVQVVMTATESADTSLVDITSDIVVDASSDAVSEAQTNERNETTEMAFPIGSSESPRGGDLDN